MTTIFLLAVLAGSPAIDDDVSDRATGDNPARLAVDRALPLIAASMSEYPKHRDCFSCHHQAVPVMAMVAARESGFAVDPDVIALSVEHTEADLRSAIESYRKSEGQPGGVTRAGYALWTLNYGGTAPDDLTRAVAGFLLDRDEERGAWRTSSNRPPSEASTFTSTYLALAGLKTYAGADRADRVAKRTEKVREWLPSTRPKDTEDRVFRLLAMKEAGTGADALREAADELAATRNDDGGWPQVEGAASDAYATGSALVALHRAGGMATDDPIYQNGLKFLIATQKPDGSWFVPSRSKAFQPYFESGFPYKKDQFISMAATSWAVAALAIASR